MDPLIVQFEDALPAHDCQQLIQRFRNAPRKQAGRTGSGVDLRKKNSSDLTISALEDWRDACEAIDALLWRALAAYCRRYPHMVTGALSPSLHDPASDRSRTLHSEDIERLDDTHLQHLLTGIYRLDGINMQHYRQAEGGYHHWHSEHFPHPSDPEQHSLHRVLLWLLYLNDVEEGGETEFFYQGAKIRPRQGSLILAPCGFTHTHRGNVPRSGDKYVLTSWVLYRPAANLYAPAGTPR
ncbi:2OG-Fe(II) oxygenase family protein [Microbulbifer guangxiensis]|uniref:2OG-Fe(II) oxygenase family protein n=1 Tax=Microbulbifer guangxiensis TaxID=2904249 RepID=UPI001F3DFFF5|nr:2OG-Fe(II) oxygenase [Microbulbifer guangxiensis]